MGAQRSLVSSSTATTGLLVTGVFLTLKTSLIISLLQILHMFSLSCRCLSRHCIDASFDDEVMQLYEAAVHIVVLLPAIIGLYDQ